MEAGIPESALLLPEQNYSSDSPAEKKKENKKTGERKRSTGLCLCKGVGLHQHSLVLAV